MRISVALCTHQGARWLGEQLASIAAQTSPPHELVVSDDASTDETQAIVRDFAGTAPFPVRLFGNPRALGVGANFGAAMARCEGDWIAFADQDDVWRPRKLETLARAAAAHPDADLLFSDARCVDESLRPLGYTLWDAIGFTPARRAAWASGGAVDVLLWRNVATGAAAMVRASRRELLLPIADGWIHDGWSAMLLALVGVVVPVGEELLDYRQHGANQVGARPLSVLDQLHHARTTPRDDYRRQRDALARLRHRAQLVRSSLTDAERARLDAAMPRVEEKLAHLALRAGLPDARWRRVPTVMSELLSGRYGRFASGAKSAVRDLVL